MDKPVLRLMIHEKLADGRLPHDTIPRSTNNAGVQFHVAYFLWNVERQVVGHEPSGPA